MIKSLYDAEFSWYEDPRKCTKNMYWLLKRDTCKVTGGVRPSSKDPYMFTTIVKFGDGLPTDFPTIHEAQKYVELHLENWFKNVGFLDENGAWK